MLATIPHSFLRSVSTDSHINRKTDSIVNESHINLDTVDNPLLKLIGKPLASEDDILKIMKLECNRLYTYKDKWPVHEPKPESLAEAGLFYLQEEDRVQCPFCQVILYDWTSADSPLREHIKKSPQCPFLKGSHDCGNVPLIARQKKYPKQHISSQQPTLNQVDYKPKHPGMADFKKRLLTYCGWPYSDPDPRVLAECGLYYSGVADVVKCFFCAGALGNWEPSDDPWDEHKKFFPDCAFLTLSARSNVRSSKTAKSDEVQYMKPFTIEFRVKSPDITTDIVQEALHIFPKPMVMDAIAKKAGNVNSLEELCDDILSSKTEKNECPDVTTNNTHMNSKVIESDVSSKPDALLCKICMDRDREAVFQPCGHLVSCWNCSQRLRTCPMCRKNITHVLRTYFS